MPSNELEQRWLMQGDPYQQYPGEQGPRALQDRPKGVRKSKTWQKKYPQRQKLHGLPEGRQKKRTGNADTEKGGGSRELLLGDLADAERRTEKQGDKRLKQPDDVPMSIGEQQEMLVPMTQQMETVSSSSSDDLPRRTHEQGVKIIYPELRYNPGYDPVVDDPLEEDPEMCSAQEGSSEDTSDHDVPDDDVKDVPL